jgi:hypothetical protein
VSGVTFHLQTPLKYKFTSYSHLFLRTHYGLRVIIRLITLHHTHTHTLDRTLDEAPAGHRDLYRTTPETNKYPCRRGVSNQ